MKAHATQELLRKAYEKVMGHACRLDRHLAAPAADM